MWPTNWRKKVYEVIFSALLLLHGNCLAANFVQLHDEASVSDMGGVINYALSRMGKTLQLAEVKPLGENEDYYLFGYTSNQPPNGSAVLAFANKAGKISKMAFIAAEENAQGIRECHDVLFAALVSLGATAKQADQIISSASLRSENYIAGFWSRSTSRRYVVKLAPQGEYPMYGAFGTFTLYAVDE